MAQQIVTWCDWHMERDERVPGTTRSVAIEGPPKLIDACDPCWKEHGQPLAEFAAALGRPDSDGPLSSAPMVPTRKAMQAIHPQYSCPECGLELTRQGLRSHLKGQHDIVMAVIEGRQGHTFAGEPTTEYCACGAGFTTGTGVSAHIRAAQREGGKIKHAVVKA